MPKDVGKRKRTCREEEEDRAEGKKTDKLIPSQKLLTDLENGGKVVKRLCRQGEEASSSKQGHEDVAKPVPVRHRHEDVAKPVRQRHEDVAKPVPVRQRHEDVAKTVKQRHEDVAKTVLVRQRHEDVAAKSQKHFEFDSLSRHHDVLREPSIRKVSSNEGSEDETSLASLAKILRRDREHLEGDYVAPSVSSNYRREDDANTSKILEEDVLSGEASFILTDHSSESDSDVSLDQEVISLLGKNVIQSSKFGPPIQKDLSEIWSGILNNGLDSEERQELMRKFPHPENCISLAPPKLNPLVISACSESVVKRDKRLADIQAQLSAAISSIGSAVTTLLKKKGDRDVIQQLGESGRMLTDLFHQDTHSRRELVALNLNKSLKETLFNTPNDEWLFGKDLEDRVKSHKNLAQSSKDLKDEKVSSNRASSSSYPKRSLNFKSSSRKFQGLRRGERQQYHQQQPRRDHKTRDKWFRKSERQGQRSSKYRQ
nr:hypothetical protein [Rickettsia endosymbiont of Ceutorhynchus assimilis]